jgi:hypothetical protein
MPILSFLTEKSVEPGKIKTFFTENGKIQLRFGKKLPRSVVLVKGKIWGLQHFTSLRSL